MAKALISDRTFPKSAQNWGRRRFTSQSWIRALASPSASKRGGLNSRTGTKHTALSVGGIVNRYKKGDIVSRTRQKLSIMPAGAQQAMSLDDLADLVEYLSSHSR